MPIWRVRKSGDIQGMGYVFWLYAFHFLEWECRAWFCPEGACSRYIVGVSRFRVASFSIEDHCCYRVVVGRWDQYPLIWRRAACMTRRDETDIRSRHDGARQDAQARSGPDSLSFFPAFSASRAGPVRRYEVHKAALSIYTAGYRCCAMSSCRGLWCSDAAWAVRSQP